jgi:peroxiredoxin
MSEPSIGERLGAAFKHFRDLEAPLNERLDGYTEASREIFPDYANAVDRLVARLNDHDGAGHAPDVGDEMPDFLLPDDNGRLLALSDLIARGPTAVMFHRGHWCPYCRMNIAAVVRARQQIASKGGQIVVIMPETQHYAKVFKLESGAPYPVLSDVDNAYALALGLAIWLGPDIPQILAQVGRTLPAYHGNDAWMLPIPATFVVGQDQIIKARFIDPDFRRRMDIDKLIAAFTRGL